MNVSNIENLKQYKHIHLIGVGGISMSAIAEVLHNLGIFVTGSDCNRSKITDKLASHGIYVSIGHNTNLVEKSDFVIYSAAIKQDDPEIICAKTNNIPIVERADFVGFLTRIYDNTIGIAGTHGKTTTTSMISLCFMEAKLDPNFQVGAILKEIGSNYRVGNSDDIDCLELRKNTIAKMITFGIQNDKCNFIARNIRYNEEGFPIFDVYHNNAYFGEFKLSIPGVHNVYNALACIAMCVSYGIQKHIIKSALAKFTGASRRFELVGSYSDINIYDDYAHHPSEVLATAKAMKNKKYRQSWVIFQPHTYSRTKELLGDFAEALLSFDNIIITDIYAARETNTYGISSKNLVTKIEELGKTAIYISDFDDIAKYIKSHACPHDIVLTLGAGTVTDVAAKILT